MANQVEAFSCFESKAAAAEIEARPQTLRLYKLNYSFSPTLSLAFLAIILNLWFNKTLEVA